MITEAQRLARANKIGSSDAAAIIGVDPYQSKDDVWLVKTGQAADFDGNEATERGNLLEPVLIEYAMRRLGWKHAGRDRMFEHPSGLLVANLDACNEDNTEIIEAKSTVLSEEFGEELTDEVPDRVIAQTAHQFACVPTARVCWVPVLLPGYRSFDWRMYRVERNAELVLHVARAGIEFMEKFVIPRIKPDDFRPTLEVLRRVRRVPKKIVEIDPALVVRCLAARELLKVDEANKEKADSYLLAAMGDAEGAIWDGGKVSFMETHRKAYEVKATTYRSLRITPDKVKKLPPAPEENPPMLGDDEISGAIDQASGQVFSDADSGL